MSLFNATVYRLDPQTGAELDVFAAEVDDEGHILRSTWLRFTGLTGIGYDAYLRSCGDAFRIERDGGQGYHDRLLGLALPPPHQR